jgi:hypothetical protein
MGCDDDEPDSDGVIVLSDDMLKREAERHGATLTDAPDDISWLVRKDGRKAFIPKGATLNGYNQSQLDYVKDILSGAGGCHKAERGPIAPAERAPRSPFTGLGELALFLAHSKPNFKSSKT